MLDEETTVSHWTRVPIFLRLLYRKTTTESLIKMWKNYTKAFWHDLNQQIIPNQNKDPYKQNNYDTGAYSTYRYLCSYNNKNCRETLHNFP